jgi:alpha-tubulin suppressor-like RCC1 family protein
MKKIYFFFLLILINNNIFSQCFINLKAGYNHVVGQKTDGTIWVWGWGNWGQLNNSTNFDEPNPILIDNTNNWMSVGSGGANTFAIKNNGTLWACGYNLYGELGIGSTASNSDVLVQVGAATNWKDVVSSDSQTIALKTDNTLWGWGQNDAYQVGNGTCCSDVLSPVLVSSATDWKMIAVSGVRASFALKNNGTLWGWGLNGGMLLGDSSVSTIHVPTQLNNTTNWREISIGAAHALALKNDNTLWSWGGNGNGEGAHPTGSTYIPQDPYQIDGSWSKVATGYFYSLGIKTDGTLWGWGKNDVGQLGIGITADVYTPVQIGTDTNWSSVSAGYQHVVAIKTNGAVVTWGGNDYGQLGNGTTTAVTTPTVLPVAGCALSNSEFSVEINNLTLSPNPVSNELTLHYKGVENVNTICIYDLLGKNVYQSKPATSNNLTTIFSVSELQSGTYLVVLKNNEKTVVSKQLVKE